MTKLAQLNLIWRNTEITFTVLQKDLTLMAPKVSEEDAGLAVNTIQSFETIIMPSKLKI